MRTLIVYVECEAYHGDPHEFSAYRIVDINSSSMSYELMGKRVKGKLERTEDPCDAIRSVKIACGQERIN